MLTGLSYFPLYAIFTMSSMFRFWTSTNRPRSLRIAFPWLRRLCTSKTTKNISRLRTSWTLVVLKNGSSTWSNGKNILIQTTLGNPLRISQSAVSSKNSIVEIQRSPLLHLVAEFMPSHSSRLRTCLFGNFDFHFLFNFYVSSLFCLWILSVFYAIYFYFMVSLESIFSFSVVNAKITMRSRSSEDFAQKEEDTVMVWRLFHISTWTSTRVP